MGFFDQVTSWLRREAADAKTEMDDLGNRMNQDLDQREAELSATPEEQLDMTMSKIDDSEDSFDELADEIRARAEAAEELEPPET